MYILLLLYVHSILFFFNHFSKLCPWTFAFVTSVPLDTYPFRISWKSDFPELKKTSFPLNNSKLLKYSYLLKANGLF